MSGRMVSVEALCARLNEYPIPTRIGITAVMKLIEEVATQGADAGPVAIYQYRPWAPCNTWHDTDKASYDLMLDADLKRIVYATRDAALVKDEPPVAWATKLPSGNLSSVRPSLKGAEKRTAAWNERFQNPPHAVTVALCECATRDAAPSDAPKPREVKRDSDFSVIVVFSSCRLASEFERQMIAASEPRDK